MLTMEPFSAWTFRPFPTPDRRERRGEFPQHDDRPRPILSAARAKREAHERLEKWREENGR